MNETKSIVCPQCGGNMPPGSSVCPRCAAAFLQATATDGPGAPARGFTPPSIEALAPLFPQLQILSLLGRGGMGAVYKARQKELDRVVALKILPPGVGVDPAFAERFAREARALARLDHPGIVTIHDFGQVAGLGESPATAEPLYYFVMEFVDGVTLRQLLDRGGVSSREALAIVPQICDALQFAHDQGVVHRDIKPENLMVDRRGRVKVADFGLAKLVGAGPDPLTAGFSQPAGLTDAGKVMGTPQYMAPEQISRPAEVDHRADIYALGVVLYQMLTGELPGPSLQPPSRKVSVDVRLDEVVLHALEREPDRRYQQVSEVKTAVETIAGSTGQVASPRPAWPRAFLAGFLAILLLWFLALASFGTAGATGFVVRGTVMGIVGGVVALGFYALVKRAVLGASLAGGGLVVLWWFGLALVMTGQPVAGIVGLVGAVGGTVWFFKKSGLPRSFLRACSTVFFIGLVSGAAVTWLMTDSYVGTARIKIDRSRGFKITLSGTEGTNPGQMPPEGFYDPFFIQTEFEVFQSERILGRVVEDLDLCRRWGKRYRGGEPLKPAEAIGILRGRLELRPVRNTMLIEICAFSEYPDEAAQLANGVVRAYKDWRDSERSRFAAELSPTNVVLPAAKMVREGSMTPPILPVVEVIDTATPATKPCRPNKPANLAVAALLGLLLGVPVGWGWDKRKRPVRN